MEGVSQFNFEHVHEQNLYQVYVVNRINATVTHFATQFCLVSLEAKVIKAIKINSWSLAENLSGTDVNTKEFIIDEIPGIFPAR